MPRRSPELERTSTTPGDFISQHQVFRLEEIEAAYRDMGRPASAARATLAYYVNQARLFVVRRGVYAHLTSLDEWLLASKLTPDAVISHDGALSIRKLAPLGSSLSFLTAHRTTPTLWEDLLCRPVRVSEENLSDHVTTETRFGQPVLVTSLERTLVDCLERLDHAPEPEELLSAFLATEDETSTRQMIDWALTYKSPLLISRLTFFLRCRRRDLETPILWELGRSALRSPDYFLRSKKSEQDTLIRSCNLIVPPALAEKWPLNR